MSSGVTLHFSDFFFFFLRLTSAVSSNVEFLLRFQQTLVGALLTQEDEGVLITSLVKKLQKTPWAFSTLWEAV